jgi:hypothetical protein
MNNLIKNIALAGSSLSLSALTSIPSTQALVNKLPVSTSKANAQPEIVFKAALKDKPYNRASMQSLTQPTNSNLIASRAASKSELARNYGKALIRHCQSGKNSKTLNNSGFRGALSFSTARVTDGIKYRASYKSGQGIKQPTITATQTIPTLRGTPGSIQVKFNNSETTQTLANKISGRSLAQACKKYF